MTPLDGTEPDRDFEAGEPLAWRSSSSVELSSDEISTMGDAITWWRDRVERRRERNVQTDGRSHAHEAEANNSGELKFGCGQAERAGEVSDDFNTQRYSASAAHRDVFSNQDSTAAFSTQEIRKKRFRRCEDVCERKKGWSDFVGIDIPIATRVTAHDNAEEAKGEFARQSTFLRRPMTKG